ncbi:MAG TPA: hypothetical protein VGM57_00145, partial [Pseudolabrys sp.]
MPRGSSACACLGFAVSTIAFPNKPTALKNSFIGGNDMRVTKILAVCGVALAALLAPASAQDAYP